MDIWSSPWADDAAVPPVEAISGTRQDDEDFANPWEVEDSIKPHTSAAPSQSSQQHDSKPANPAVEQDLGPRRDETRDSGISFPSPTARIDSGAGVPDSGDQVYPAGTGDAGSGCDNNIKAPLDKTNVNTPPISSSYNDDFGDFATTNGSVDRICGDPTATALDTRNDNAGAGESSRRGLATPHEEIIVRNLSLPASRSLVDTNLSPMKADRRAVEPPDDLIASVSARKAWHRLTRPQPLRQVNSGAADDYVRVTWHGSEVRRRTLDIVGRWATQDRINGGVVLGGSLGTAVFGWDRSELRARPQTTASSRLVPLRTASGVFNPGTGISGPAEPTGRLEPHMLVPLFAWSTTAVSEHVDRALEPPPNATNPETPVRAEEMTGKESSHSRNDSGIELHSSQFDGLADWGEMVQSPINPNSAEACAAPARAQANARSTRSAVTPSPLSAHFTSGVQILDSAEPLPTWQQVGLQRASSKSSADPLVNVVLGGLPDLRYMLRR